MEMETVLERFRAGLRDLSDEELERTKVLTMTTAACCGPQTLAARQNDAVKVETARRAASAKPSLRDALAQAAPKPSFT